MAEIEHAPDAPRDAGDAGPRRRPVLVYVIVGFVFLSVAWTIAGVWLLATFDPAADASEEMARLRAALGPVDLGFMGVLLVLNLLAAVALFRLRRAAVGLFGAVVAVTLLNQLWMFLFQPQLVAAQGPIAGIAGVVLPLLFLLYASRLARRGVLD